MKKLGIEPRAVARELLEGFVALAPGQALLEEETGVVRADTPADPHQRKVAVIPGGGRGHEPAHVRAASTPGETAGSFGAGRTV